MANEAVSESIFTALCEILTFAGHVAHNDLAKGFKRSKSDTSSELFAMQTLLQATSSVLCG
jgi:hypothetical protein